MKATHRASELIAEKRTRKEKEGITDDEERLLWSKDLLGDKTAQSLVYTIYFHMGKIFGLRACEHRELRLSNFVIEKNKICYRENIFKTFYGGLKDLKKKPRMVTHSCHEDDDSVHEPFLWSASYREFMNHSIFDRAQQLINLKMHQLVFTSLTQSCPF